MLAPVVVLTAAMGPLVGGRRSVRANVLLALLNAAFAGRWADDFLALGRVNEECDADPMPKHSDLPS